jgi:hypothetical protein
MAEAKYVGAGGGGGGGGPTQKKKGGAPPPPPPPRPYVFCEDIPLVQRVFAHKHTNKRDLQRSCFC